VALIHRKQKINATWALQAAEAGSLASFGVTIPNIAYHMELSQPYVANLITLYFGYKDFPELLKIPNIIDANDTLKRLKGKK
jgi:hypothetical protein